MKYVWLAVAAWNLYTFILMGVDKRRAKKKAWRITERRLLLSSAVFGALGGTAGMFFFRHKTKHFRFRFGLPAMLAVQAAIVIFAVKEWI